MNRTALPSALRPTALLYALGACLFHPQSGHGEENLFFDELPIIASVSRLPQQQKDLPASVTVIDRAMIKASGAQDLSEVLRLVPGFQTFVRNTESPRVTYHGIPDSEQSSRIQVLIDGRSQFSPLFGGGVNWSLLPVALEDIERIEVTRGSNAASFGGNAFQAMVNVITEDTSLSQGTTLAARVGNRGESSQTLRQGGRLGEAGNYRLTYNRRSDSGLVNRADWLDGYGSEMLTWRADLAVDTYNSLQIDAGWMHAQLRQGRFASPDNPPHDLRWTTSYLQTQWRRLVGSDAELQLRYSLIEDRLDQRYDGSFGNYTFTYDPHGSRALRHEIELLYHRSIAGNLRSVWGASHRQENVDSAFNFAGQGTVSRDTSRVFANLEWKPLPTLTGNLGLAAEHDSYGGWMPSARLGLNYHLSPRHTLRLGFSRSERAGSPSDYRGRQNVELSGIGSMFLTQGNGGLGNERFASSELGYLGNWPNLGLQLDVRAFAERIPNRWFTIERRYPECQGNGGSALCYYQSFRALRTPQELQEIDIRGVEYQSSWTLNPQTRLVFGQALVRIAANYLPQALNDPANRAYLSSEALANTDQLSERSAPHLASSAMLMHRLGNGIELSAFAQWVGAMKWSTNTSVAPYHRLDLRVGYPFRVGGSRAEIAYIGQNLNGRHGEYSAYGRDSDRIVTPTHWLSFALSL